MGITQKEDKRNHSHKPTKSLGVYFLFIKSKITFHSSLMDFVQSMTENLKHLYQATFHFFVMVQHREDRKT